MLNLSLLRTLTLEMIRHGFSLPGERSDTDSFDNTNTEIITRNNERDIIIDEWEKLELLLLTHFYNYIILFHEFYFFI